MPDPRYISSEAQISAPGVYVQELAPAVPTRGQRRRIVAFAGECVRGPVGRAVRCTSYKRFVEVFGGRDKGINGGTIAGHVWKALQGKRWGAFYVTRAAAAAAVVASFTFETAAGGAGTPVLRIDAANAGTWGNDVMVRIFPATNGVATSFNMQVKLYGQIKLYENLSINATDDNLASVIGSDDANWIVATKLAAGRPVDHAAAVDGADADGFVNLGEVVASFTSVAGTDGAIADTDFTATGKAMEIIDRIRGVHACAVVGRSNAAIKAKASTLAAATTQRVWFITSDAASTTQAAAITERQSLSGGRLSYWWNHCYIRDPITDEEIAEEPFLVNLSIISQTDPDMHVGDFENSEFTAAIRRVYNELGPEDRDALYEAGVSFMHKDLDAAGNEMFIAGNAVTCDLAVNNMDLDGRYMKDYLIDAIATRLRGDQFKGNTKSARAERASSILAFLEGLARTERYIMTDEDSGKPLVSYVNDGSVNTLDAQATGLQVEQCIARLIPKNKQILLNITVGVDATVSEN